MIKRVLGFTFIIIASYILIVQIIRLPDYFKDVVYFLDLNYTINKFGSLLGFITGVFLNLIIIYLLFRFGVKWIKK